MIGDCVEKIRDAEKERVGAYPRRYNFGRSFTAVAAVNGTLQALQDELERSRLELEQAVKEKDSTIAAKDKEISQVSLAGPLLKDLNSAAGVEHMRSSASSEKYVRHFAWQTLRSTALKRYGCECPRMDSSRASTRSSALSWLVLPLPASFAGLLRQAALAFPSLLCPLPFR